MPSSEHHNLTTMVAHLRDFTDAKTIVDAGIGCGKWGHLVREYLDGHWNKRKFHDRSTWRIKLFGIEGFKDYVTKVHRLIYDEIIIDNFHPWLINTDKKIDLVIMGDTIEHLTKQEGEELLNRSNIRAFLISTPAWDCKHKDNQKMVFGNEFERHRSHWTSDDFFSVSNFRLRKITQDGRLLTALLKR